MGELSQPCRLGSGSVAEQSPAQLPAAIMHRRPQRKTEQIFKQPRHSLVKILPIADE
jgi:hypothetical protein